MEYVCRQLNLMLTLKNTSRDRFKENDANDDNLKIISNN